MGINKNICFLFLLLGSIVNGQSVTEHIVVKGNTLYSISKTYGISVESLQEANPNILGNSISIGDTLIIVVGEESMPVTEPVVQDTVESSPHKVEYEMYKVKKRDTPEDLARQWGFSSMKAFFSLNPDARTDWKKGMILVKPVVPGSFVEVATDSIPTETEADTAVVRELITDVKILGLLPFFHKHYINETPLAKRSPLALSFRQGMELAIEQLNDSSLSIDITYADTYNHTDSLRLAIERNPLDSFDLIVGPLYSKRVFEISKYAQAHRVISPLSKNVSINATPLQNAVVAEEHQWQTIVDLIANRQELHSALQNPRKALIVAKNNEKTQSTLNELFSAFQSPTIILSGDKWRENTQLSSLNPSIYYDLIIYDNDPAFVLDVLRNLRSGQASYTWYTNENQISENGITSDNFAREKEVICAFSSYVDYTSEENMVMVEAFRTKFGNQPDEYALKGYDIIQFYLRNLLERTPEYRGIALGFKPDTEGKNTYAELRVFRDFEWKKFNHIIEQKD